MTSRHSLPSAGWVVWMQTGCNEELKTVLYGKFVSK